MQHRRRSLPLILSSLLAATLIAAATPVTAAAAAAPTGFWALKGTLANSAGTGLKLAKLGTPAFQTVTVKGTDRKALVFAPEQGLKVTGIPQSGRRSYTIETWFEFDDMGAAYLRILSFGPNDMDEGLYLFAGYPYLFDDKFREDLVLPANTFVRVRVTRDAATNVMRLYLNGKLAFRSTDTTGKYVLRQGTIVLFQDDGDENGSGTVAGIKVWNKPVAP